MNKLVQVTICINALQNVIAQLAKKEKVDSLHVPAMRFIEEKRLVKKVPIILKILRFS